MLSVPHYDEPALSLLSVGILRHESDDPITEGLHHEMVRRHACFGTPDPS